jgi:magnesium transporter
MALVIVDAAWYVEGRRTLETDSIEKLAAERGGAGFGWLGLRMPTDRELDDVRDAFDLPELAIADARNKHDRPKVERHGDCLLTVVPTARYLDDLEEVEFGELFLYAGRDYILSVRYGNAAPLAGVRHGLEERADRLARGPGAVLQAALLHVVESYEPVIEGLEHDVREVEREVFNEAREQPTKRIYLLIREVLDFLVALEPMSAAVKKLTSTECMQWVHPDTVPLFRDVDDALSGIVERGRTVHQLLQNALTASRAEAERQQNEDTRKISAWAAIGIVPTIVAGLFGMNLGGIPLADHGLGFAIISALSLLLCVGLYRRFKRIKWL